MLLANTAVALPPGVVYRSGYFFEFGQVKTITFMYNRNNTKKLALYVNPSWYSACVGTTTVWVMGHPNNAQGVGFSNNDWQDLEVAKKNTGGYYRWGCCYSSDPYNTICLN
jgi:hypothetical protein